MSNARSLASFLSGTPTADFNFDSNSLVVDISENTVGIGDTTPDGKLEVRQTASADILNLYDDTTNVLTVVDGGNVGIGDDSPDGKLEVRQSGTDDIFNLYDDTTNVLTVVDGGKVGIGTSTPDGLVDIRQSGTDDILNLYDGTDNIFTVVDGGKVGIKSATPDGMLDVRSLTSDDIFNLYDGSTNVFTVIDGGNVGIGTSAPTEVLQVVGKVKATKIVGRGEQENSSGFQSDTFCVEGVNTTNNATSHGAVFASKHASSFPLICGAHDSTFNIFKVRADGKLFAEGLGQETGHTTLAVRSSDGMIVRNTSSRRYKSNIVDTTIDSTLISNIQVRDFTWTETGNNYIGLIAEEVNEHLPKAVVKTTENDEILCESIDWSALTSLLIDYCQKLEQRIVTLENA